MYEVYYDCKKYEEFHPDNLLYSQRRHLLEKSENC